MAKQEGCETVNAQPVTEATDAVDTDEVGVIADFAYLLELTAETKRKRTICFRRKFFERFGSERGVADREKRERVSIKLYVQSVLVVRDLQKCLPGISVQLLDPRGSAMTEIDYQRLRHDAEALGINANGFTSILGQQGA